MEPILSHFETSSTVNCATSSPMIFVSGTALDRNELWRQILSDCTQNGL